VQRTVKADLAPPVILRATELDVTQLARRSRGRRSERQRRIVAIGDAIGAYVQSVDIYTCNVGQGAAAPFLDSLAETWRVSVRGLVGLLRSRGQSGGPVQMELSTRDRSLVGPWENEIPPSRCWRRSQLLERQIELPGGLRKAPVGAATVVATDKGTARRARIVQRDRSALRIPALTVSIVSSEKEGTCVSP